MLHMLAYLDDISILSLSLVARLADLAPARQMILKILLHRRYIEAEATIRQRRLALEELDDRSFR